VNRSIGGIPILGWIAALGALGAGIWYIKRKPGKAATGTASTSAPAFSQAQEVQDFQIFSSLTSQQQASDESFVSQMLSLFGGGSSSGAGSATGSGGSGSTGTTYTPPTGETASGSGYSLPGETLAAGYQAPGQASSFTENGVTYVPFSSPAAQWAAASAGTPIYQQTAPGVFSLTNANTSVAPNTPVYEAAS
jgi:hypothetical protein